MISPRWKITFERTPTSWTLRIGFWWCLIFLAVIAWLVFG